MQCPPNCSKELYVTVLLHVYCLMSSLTPAIIIVSITANTKCMIFSITTKCMIVPASAKCTILPITNKFTISPTRVFSVIFYQNNKKKGASKRGCRTKHIMRANKFYQDVAKFRYLVNDIKTSKFVHEGINSKIIPRDACYCFIQNLYSSHLLSKNVKVKIFKKHKFACYFIWRQM